MQRKILLHIAFLCSVRIISQTAHYFHLSLPETKRPYSLYNSISFVDSRKDTNDFGRLYSDKVKRSLNVALKIDLETQFNWWLHNATDSTALAGELVVQLRKLKFIEANAAAPDFCYCPVRLDLYAKNGSGYTLLGRLDTIVAEEKGRVATELLFEKTGRVIGDFLSTNLYVQPFRKEIRSNSEIHRIDEIEKQSAPLYKKTVYTEGAYTSFESFKKQVPEFKLSDVRIKRGEIKYILVPSDHSWLLRKEPKDLYGFVYRGRPYVSGEFGFSALEKKEDEFYFYAKARTTVDAASWAIARGIALPIGGILGVFIARQIVKEHAVGIYLMQLDHVDGSFTRLKEIK